MDITMKDWMFLRSKVIFILLGIIPLLVHIALLLGLLQDVHYYHQLVLHTGRVILYIMVTDVMFKIPMVIQILKLLKVKQCVLITKKDKSNGIRDILWEIIQLLFVKRDTQ